MLKSSKLSANECEDIRIKRKLKSKAKKGSCACCGCGPDGCAGCGRCGGDESEDGFY